MYYLSKFCRICVQTGVKLMDIDTVDFDSVKLSEKLEVCTKMQVISRESLSTDICTHCVAKLRISYQFQDMCKRSTKILQGYLTELISGNDKPDQEKFINTELNVTVKPLPDVVWRGNKQNEHEVFRRKQRITKEQRCSLLKQLLTPSSDKMKKERDKIRKNSIYLKESYKGGLKNIIDFTRNYEFSFNLDKNSNIESTPLEKLKAFSNNFFRKDFSEFRSTILYIIENKDKFYDSSSVESEDEYSFNSDIDENIIKFEEVVVEPDIKIKNELMDYEEGDGFAYNYVETSYNNIECKKEVEDYTDITSSLTTNMPNIYSDYADSFHCAVPVNASVQLLDNLVHSYPHGSRKVFSPSNVRCRTRNNPYINPLLKEQFLYRSFKCDKCSRYFKSPGYLKAHNSKVH